MLTDARIRQIARDAGFGGISDSDVELCRTIEAEATAELRTGNERLRGLLQADRDTFHALDVRGGLGYEAHDRIRVRIEAIDAALGEKT